MEELFKARITQAVNRILGKDHGNIGKNQTDLVNWKIICKDLGEFDLSLKLYNESDTTDKKITLNVVQSMPIIAKLQPHLQTES